MHSIHIVRVSRYGPGSATLTGLSVSLERNCASCTAIGRLRPEPAEHGRVAYVARRHVQRAQFLLEVFGIVDQRQQVGERNELAVVQPAADEAGVAVAALLAVGDHIDFRAQLRVHAQAHGVVGGRLELFLRQPALQAVVHRLHHPAWPWPAADAHHRQRRDRRRGGGLGQSLAEPCRLGGLDAAAAPDWRRGACAGAERSARAPLHTRNDVALPPAAATDTSSLPCETAPGGQVFLDRDLGRDDLQQATARQRIDVAADQEQQAAAAVQIAPVEGGVGSVGVEGGR